MAARIRQYGFGINLGQSAYFFKLILTPESFNRYALAKGIGLMRQWQFIGA